MPNNNPEEDNLFTSHCSNEIFSDQPSTENDLFPHTGYSEGELYPEFRATEADLQGIKSFLDAQNLCSLDKKRLISYYRDIDLRQKKYKTKSPDALF